MLKYATRRRAREGRQSENRRQEGDKKNAGVLKEHGVHAAYPSSDRQLGRSGWGGVSAAGGGSAGSVKAVTSQVSSAVKLSSTMRLLVWKPVPTVHDT